MPRTYSKGACFKCKARKKKCDEEKPACRACARLGFKCSYNYRLADLKRACDRGITFGHSELVETLYLGQNPHIWTARNEAEYQALCRAPPALQAFYGPFCGQEHQDLRLLWQLARVDPLIRDATVACFSLVFGCNTPRHGKARHAYYSSALQLVRERVTHQRHDRNALLALQAAVVFLGLMDSLGPEEPPDLHLHWKGLAQILAHRHPAIMTNVSPLQENVFLLALEATAYHFSIQMLFAKDATDIWRLWRENRIYEMLEKTIPDRVERITKSPLLCGCGDYVMYDLIVQVTYLCRISSNESINNSTVENIESVLRQLDISLEARFTQHDELKHSALQVYRMCLGSLKIMVTTLKEFSHDRSQFIHRNAIEVFEAFSRVRATNMNHTLTTWPVQILACAIRSESEFARFKNELVELKLRLDPGHARRLDAVVEEVECIRLATHYAFMQHESTFPPALILLRKPNGILS